MKLIAPMALFLLAACGGNPLGGGDDGGGGGGADDTITVPENVRNNVNNIAYDAATDTFRVEIEAFDTSPVVATWARDARFDTAGYRGYAVQEDPLDRLFIGLGKTSDDGTVTAAVAGDGGQFNKFYSGGDYTRSGAFTPPAGTADPGSGQVSYAGSYAGLTNIPGPGGDLLPVAPGTDPEVLPNQASRVAGDIFLNANFGDNAVNGAVYNRVLVDYGFGLQSVILVGGVIAANGTFAGQAERWVNDDSSQPVVGEFAGVFGGANAGNVGGVVALEELYGTATGEVLEAAQERGVFVLRQCGLTGDAAICDGALPDFGN